MDLGKDVPAQNLLTRLTGDMIAGFYAAGYWQDHTIYDLAKRNAAANPGGLAVVDSHCGLTYGQLIDLADAVARDLAASELRPGDRVALWTSSRVEVAAFLLACSRNGYVFCPSLHRNHTVDEVASLVSRMRARAVVAEEGYGAGSDGPDVFAALSGLEHVARVYRLPLPGLRGLEAVVSALGLKHGAPADETPATSPDDVVYLAFTSGTTGEPKGVMHSNNTLLANARSMAADWNFTAGSVIYTLSPLSHNLGFGALVLSLLVGGRIVLHDLARGASLLQKLQDISATFVFGVPAHAMDLLAEIESAGGANLGSLKGFRVSGAAAPPVVVEKLIAYGIFPQSGYGMTEACSHHYTLPGDDPNLIVSTSGKACPGYEVRIFSIDDPDEPLAVGEVGQIGGRGASLMLGYFGNQDATESSFNRSGWFMTGDLGRLDENGYLQITGRIKDVIIRGGHNIHPAKIEALAMRYPQVERAAAIAVKDERLGEKVCIAVMPKKGNEIVPDLLLSHLHEGGLSKYDMPEYFLQVDEIPLSASGKVLKRVLASRVTEGALTPQPVRFRS